MRDVEEDSWIGDVEKEMANLRIGRLLQLESLDFRD